jgi:hypothetical protein
MFYPIELHNILKVFLFRVTWHTVMTGLGVGVASGMPSVLLAEIATTETRGSITTMHQVGGL